MVDVVRFARNGSSDPDGKLDGRIEVACTAALEEAVTALATLASQGKSEYVRRLLEEHCFGRLEVIRKRAG